MCGGAYCFIRDVCLAPTGRILCTEPLNHTTHWEKRQETLRDMPSLNMSYVKQHSQLTKHDPCKTTTATRNSTNQTNNHMCHNELDTHRLLSQTT